MYPIFFESRLNVDLISDVEALLKESLEKHGVKLSPNKNIMYQYCNVLIREIEPRKRAVFKSKSFKCPPHLKATLAEMENKILNGADLNCYLSKTLLTGDYNDDILNDWNIYHLHINPYQQDNFVERSDYLLFACITPDIFYMIDIKKHNENNLWYKSDLLKTVYQNWPSLLNRVILENANTKDFLNTPQEIKSFRRAHITTPTKLSNSTASFPPGGGYTADGSSITATRYARAIHNHLACYQLILHGHFEKLFIAFQTYSPKPLKVLNLTIDRFSNLPYFPSLIETNTFTHLTPLSQLPIKNNMIPYKLYNSLYYDIKDIVTYFIENKIIFHYSSIPPYILKILIFKRNELQNK